jgi:hypothetical protein
MDHEFIDPWTRIPRFIARLSASASSLQSLSSEAFITNIAAWFSNLERAHTHNGAGQLQGHGIRSPKSLPGWSIPASVPAAITPAHWRP